jgi:plasmid maintenance system antidote protein VapI
MSKIMNPIKSRMEKTGVNTTQLAITLGYSWMTIHRAVEGKLPLSLRVAGAMDAFFGEQPGTIYREYREWMISKIHIGGVKK